MRCRIGGRNMSVAPTCGDRRGLPPAPAACRRPPTSVSIDCIKASASALRPCDSSQRGDSGSRLRRYHTISEPMPAMTNIGRQPQLGMIR